MRILINKLNMITPRQELLLNGVTATTTSRAAGVSGASRLSLQIFASGITSGSAVFTVEVSNDGTNWVTYNRLTSNVTNTNAQNDARVASVLIGTNAGSMLFIPAGDTFRSIRTVVTPNNTIDGNYSSVLYVD